MKIESKSRQDWLNFRSDKIGASDVPAVLGLSKWLSTFSLWHQKKGNIQNQNDSLLLECGLALEPVIAKHFEDETGYQFDELLPYTVFIHPDEPRFFCTPDRIVVGNIPVELKTASNRNEWIDEPPLQYVIQLQAQMMIMGSDLGYLAAVINNREFIWHRVERDYDFTAAMLKSVKRFIKSLDDNIEPKPDGSDSSKMTIASLYKDQGTEIEITDSISDYIHSLTNVKKSIAELDKQKTELENLIKSYMGSNSIGTLFGEQVLTFKEQKRKPSILVDINQENDLIEHGISYKKNEGATFRTLRIKETNNV